MNVEIGSEAALFPEKEHILGIFVAVPNVTIQCCHMTFKCLNRAYSV
jgi:hypothetical protein